MTVVDEGDELPEGCVQGVRILWLTLKRVILRICDNLADSILFLLDDRLLCLEHPVDILEVLFLA